MSKIKDKLYYVLVEKNPSIRDEYQGYVNANQEEHIIDRTKHWRLLMKLNWHYRVLRKETPLLPVPEPPAPNLKLPYLNGSESEGLKRMQSIHYARRFIDYDVISFDIFDTLILRPFAKPIDLFMVIGNKLGIMNFQNIRVESETIARTKKEITHKTREVTIYDIYAEVAEQTGIDIQTGVDTEFETEMEFCFANPYMLQLFKMVKEMGKEIIIASDMYLPHDMMKKLLESCGYTEYTKLYVSCDYLCSKRTGGLYKNIMRDFAGKKIAHIGDNFTSDVSSAKNTGISGMFYKSCHAIGNPYRADGMSELVGSFYSGIVNTHLHNGISEYNLHYEFGFIYGGLYILGYCNWIHKKAKQEGIDKILFLSRDGYVYQKVFNMMFDDIPNEYVYWSRIITIKSTIETSRMDFLKRMIISKTNLQQSYTIREMLDSISLSALIPKFIESGFKENQLFAPELIEKAKKVFIDNWDIVIKSYEKDKEMAKQYLESVVKGCNKVAAVDVGWIGTNVMSIKRIIEEDTSLSCDVKCYIAACNGAVNCKPNYNLNELMNGTIESYMFSQFENRNLNDVHRNTNKNINVSLFEFFTQADHPSFAGFNENNGFEFDVPEVTNYRINTDIRRGILDFCSLYLEKSTQNPYLRNIAGHDAYCPFRLLTRDISLIEKLFKNYTVAISVGGNKLEILNDVLKRKGLIGG